MATPVAKKRMMLSLRRKVETISFLSELTSGTAYSLNDPEAPPWFQVGCVHQIKRTVYMYHAESNHLRWADDPKFMFAVGRQPFQLFWFKNDEYFGRQLTKDETFRFCQLTGTSMEAV